MKDKEAIIADIIKRIQFEKGSDNPFIELKDDEALPKISDENISEARSLRDDKRWDEMAKVYADRAVSAQQTGDEELLREAMRRLNLIDMMRNK